MRPLGTREAPSTGRYGGLSTGSGCLCNATKFLLLTVMCCGPANITFVDNKKYFKRYLLFCRRYEHLRGVFRVVAAAG